MDWIGLGFDLLCFTFPCVWAYLRDDYCMYGVGLDGIAVSSTNKYIHRYGPAVRPVLCYLLLSTSADLNSNVKGSNSGEHNLN